MSEAVIVILNWNGGRQTVALLGSLREQAIKAPVWVVDNGSTVDDALSFEKELPGVRIVRLERNFGFAGGMNRAVQMAQEAGFAFVYEINNDCLVTDDCVTPCLEAARRNPGAAIVGSRYLGKSAGGRYENWGYHSDPAERDRYRDGFLVTDRIVGCGMLIRCSVFSEVGGFDERFFCYGEENDLCWRLGKKGFSVGFCYGSLVLHDHQGSDTGGNAAYYRNRNLHLLRQRHPDRVAIGSPSFSALRLGWSRILHADTITATATVQGLHHGLRRRFGQRPSRLPVAAGIGLLLFYTAALIPFIGTAALISRFRRSDSSESS